jgi:hypothetical protein
MWIRALTWGFLTIRGGDEGIRTPDPFDANRDDTSIEHLCDTLKIDNFPGESHDRGFLVSPDIKIHQVVPLTRG